MPTTPLPGLYGNRRSTYRDAYGAAPIAANPLESATHAITGNLANLGSLYGLAGSYNQFQNTQAQQQLASGIPGYSNMLDQSSANIISRLRGEVPSDVLGLLGQGAAERGVSTGQLGRSPNANAAYLRALGLTSLGLQTEGENMLTAAINRTPKPELFNLNNYLVTGEQQQAAEQAANIYASLPDPYRAAMEAERLANGGGTGGNTGSGWLPGSGPFGNTGASSMYSLLNYTQR